MIVSSCAESASIPIIIDSSEIGQHCSPVHQIRVHGRAESSRPLGRMQELGSPQLGHVDCGEHESGEALAKQITAPDWGVSLQPHRQMRFEDFKVVLTN